MLVITKQIKPRQASTTQYKHIIIKKFAQSLHLISFSFHALQKQLRASPQITDRHIHLKELSKIIGLTSV